MFGYLEFISLVTFCLMHLKLTFMNIIVRIYSFLLFGAFLVVFAPFSMAQDSQQGLELKCSIIVEAIVKLRNPIFNTPTVWNAFYGQDGMEKISDVISGDEGSFIIAGSYSKDKEDMSYKPFLAKIDARGRVIWESRQDIKQKSGTHKTIKALSKNKDGYVVLGNVANSSDKNLGFYIGVYGDDGKLIREIPIYEKGYSLKALGFAPSKSGKSYIVSAVKGNGDQKEVALYKITLTGKKLWSRQYRVGGNIAFNHIELAFDGNYTLVGEIQQEGGRMAGWVARIDDSGALLWQQSYPRGRFASLMDVHTNKDNTIIASGVAKGIGEKSDSAWLMKLASDGSVIWQRYYQGKMHYSAPSLIAYNDGRISVLLNGSKVKSNDRGHVRILNISPRGELLDGSSFTDGQSAQAYTLKLAGNGDRIVAGFSQISAPDDIGNKELPPYVFDGWIFAATSLKPYIDVCTKDF